MFASREDAELLTSALGLEHAEVPRILERLEAIGGLHGLWHAGGEALEALLERRALRRLELILALAGRILAPSEPPERIDGAEDVAAYFQPRLAVLARETFWVLSLDAHLRPLASAPISEGTLTACIVHPREVYAHAIRARAACIIAVHNHPSGDPTPSFEDEMLTERLTEAGEILGIPLVDHVIVARRGFRSLGRPHAGVDNFRLERRTRYVRQ